MATERTQQAETKGYRQRGAVDRDLFDARLDAYLGGTAAAHGFRGNLGSIVASIERGGVGGGTEDPNFAMLRRIGWQEGRHDEYDPLRRPAPVLEQLRESERRFRLLTPKHQATHLAHYLGTSRCHPTLLATFGDLDGGGVAGVVLERWLAKKAKERARNGDGETAAELERARAELAPLERALAEAQAVLDAPIVLPPRDGARPMPPELPPVRSDENPEGISKAVRARLLKPYNAELRAWRAPVTKVFQAIKERRLAALATITRIAPLRPPLPPRLPELCAQLSASAASRSGAGDEQALVTLCQKLNEQGPDGRARRDELIKAAEGDVRAAHRAWRDTAKKTAKAWAEDGETAA